MNELVSTEAGEMAEDPGSRYLVLPIEAVSHMQSADFGVLMSELLPNGYITPGSFTNDGRHRVSELADDIRRNGVERPLEIYMGKTRPVVWQGHHRYVGATLAGATHLPLEITYPEDVRDLTEWAARVNDSGAEITAAPDPARVERLHYVEGDVYPGPHTPASATCGPPLGAGSVQAERPVDYPVPVTPGAPVHVAGRPSAAHTATQPTARRTP